MKKTLGLDLGTNSLGWAILDDATSEILDKGVVVFPEGSETEDKLETPAAKRRAARMGRRLKFRRKLRKWNLLRLLIENGMCPLRAEELEAWRKEGKYPVGDKAFINWLKSTDTSNPYCDRAAAANGKVAPEVLGRALYHIAQRRGFKSSRKDAAAEPGKESADARKLGAVKSGIASLNDEIAASGAKTLGEYFFKCLESGKGAVVKTRIRNRYTGRVEHYEKEFDVIMDAQGVAAGDALREGLRKAIFMQRPLRSQKHLVGNCPLEPKNPRVQIGHPAFEEFRMLAFVNNLMFEDEDGNYRDEVGRPIYPLTQDDREKVCSAFDRKTRFEFKSVNALFKKDPRFKGGKLKFHYYADGEMLHPCYTRYSIKKEFGEIAYDEQMVFDALMFFDDDEKLRAWLRRHFPELGETEVSNLVAIHPREGNAQYSLKAVNRILPFLRKGYELSEARLYAKLPDVIPDFREKGDFVVAGLRNELFAYRRERVMMADPDYRKSHKLTPYLDRCQAYLEKKWGVSAEKFGKLYLHGEDQYEPETEYRSRGNLVKLPVPRLPRVELGMIRNPSVQRSMTTLRRLVNFLAEHGKISFDDTIRIELAREVNDLAHRLALQRWQKERQKLREEAAAAIAEHHVAVTEDAIDRYLLWKEQDGMCLYTNQEISIRDLLSGNKFDIEHTVPRSLSGDDSMANKTICEAAYNRNVKRGRVPRECENWDEIDVCLSGWREKVAEMEKTWRRQNNAAKGVADPSAKLEARAKALVTRLDLDYWRDKIRRFEVDPEALRAGDGGLGGFKKRQLVDTGIMSSHAVNLLRCLYPVTYTVNGVATAFARKAWGLQGDEAKDRSDHTHHAKDAMVIAALTPARFNAICAVLKDDGRDKRRECDVCPPPCVNFAEKVRKACGEILVKHVLRQTTLRQSSRKNALAKAHFEKGDPNARLVKFVNSKGDTVRGQLHKDTFYGCICEQSTGQLKKVVRKSIVGPVKDAESILDKIVDPAIRSIVGRVVEDLKARGVKNIEPGMVSMPSGVPVNKVRIYAANAANAQELRDHAMTSRKDYKRPYYVVTAEGSNFRLAIFKRNGKLGVEPDNALVWAQNHRKPDYVPLDKRPGFVGYVKPGSMALVHREGHPEELAGLAPKELAQRLYKVVKYESTGRMTLRRHSEARASVVLSKDLKEAGKHGAGESKIEIETPHELLLVAPGTYLSMVMFEGVHFSMAIDGSVAFHKLGEPVKR